MKKGVAIGGLILVTVIWGGGFVASDMALESMKPFQIMMVRFLLASVLMGLVSMGQRKKEAKIENRAGAIKAGMLMGLTLFAGFAFQIFLTGEFVKKYPAAVLNLVQMFTAFVLSTISMFVFGETDFQVTTKGWLSVLYLAVISTTICYLLQTACQKYVEETKAAIILCMESVFGTVFSIIILHEVITPRMVVGCIIILIAVIISNLSESGGEGNGENLQKAGETA